jgi:hypothetical protein
MNKKWTSILIIILILVFSTYIIFDVALKKGKVTEYAPEMISSAIADQWIVSKVFEPGLGKLEAVATSETGNIIFGGASFVSAFTADLKPIWTLKTEKPVTAVSASGDTVFASTVETILEISGNGDLIAEWGPFEDKSIITSVSTNKALIAFADAGNRIIIILDKKGNFRKMIGKSGDPFIVPSAHFDVALTVDNYLYIANPGNSRFEKRSLDGTVIALYGEPGIEADKFSGCCNPANFTLIPGGFVTAEKGINRIKILDENGKFIELVSSVNDFKPPIPLDIASPDGKIIYGVNSADSKLYVFMRK